MVGKRVSLPWGVTVLLSEKVLWNTVTCKSGCFDNSCQRAMRAERIFFFLFFFLGCCCFVFSTPRYKLPSLATYWKSPPPIYQTLIWQEKKGNVMSNKINVGVKGDFYLL